MQEAGRAAEGVRRRADVVLHGIAVRGRRRDAHHVPFDLETVMRTGYEIDKFQRAYFVLPSFDTLKGALEHADIAAIVKRWKDAPPLDPGVDLGLQLAQAQLAFGLEGLQMAAL